MRGLKDLNRSLSTTGYKVERKKIITYLLKGSDGSMQEFNNKNELYKFINVKGLKIILKEKGGK